jgi:RNA polymerase sigma factor (sigma-70 family)
MFPTTRRSVVVRLASADASDRARAFDTLVTLYWKPLYKYLRIVRRKSPQDAEDLTQDFLMRMLERDSLARYDPSKSSFRSFILLLLSRYVADDAKSSTRLKRGGALSRVDFHGTEAEVTQEQTFNATPEEYFCTEWVRSFFSLAIDRLREECVTAGKEQHFALFDVYDLDGNIDRSYRDLAEEFGISETTVTNRLAAVRQQFRDIVLDTLREITASEHEFRREARALLGVDP